MKLEYSTLLSPNPISLSLGFNKKSIHLRQPRLIEIDREISIQQFSIYEMFLKITPELYYTKILGIVGAEKWGSFSNDEKNELTIYKVLLEDANLQEIFVKLFDFFFEETVMYTDGFFIFLENCNCEELNDEVINEKMCGVIQEKNFNEFLELIQQTCCIYTGKSSENVKFKNELARKLYEKMQRANVENEKKREKDADKNLSLANIISKVSNRHPSINPISVWNLTVFQLIDSFNSIQINEMYEISKTRVSVWGDEKNAFDAALWYKNNHDK